MAALTHDFLGETLERWQKVSPGVVVDCVEMDPETQERALLDGRIAVGILVLLSDRPILELFESSATDPASGHRRIAKIPSASGPAGNPFTCPERGTFHWG